MRRLVAVLALLLTSAVHPALSSAVASGHIGTITVTDATVGDTAIAQVDVRGQRSLVVETLCWLADTMPPLSHLNLVYAWRSPVVDGLSTLGPFINPNVWVEGQAGICTAEAGYYANGTGVWRPATNKVTFPVSP